MYIAIYLAAIILANLTVYWFGPSATIINAFLLIGLDLTCRDKLHEQWHGKNLLVKMCLLIVSGSVITFLINTGAYRIALASTIAFLVSTVVDTLVYHLLIKWHKLLKINGSNIFSSIADSILFPTIAFGSFMPWIILGQSIAKIFGGSLWSVILFYRRKVSYV